MIIAGSQCILQKFPEGFMEIGGSQTKSVRVVKIGRERRGGERLVVQARSGRERDLESAAPSWLQSWESASRARARARTTFRFSGISRSCVSSFKLQ